MTRYSHLCSLTICLVTASYQHSLFPLQAGDLKTNYIHGNGVSSENCLNPTNSVPMAKSSSSPSLEEDDQYIYLPNEGNQRPVKTGENAVLRHTVTPSDPYGVDSYLPFKTPGFIKDRGQLCAEMKKKRY